MSGVMSEKQLTINKQITLCSKGKAENNSLKHRVGRREKMPILSLFCFVGSEQSLTAHGIALFLNLSVV